MKYEEQVRDLFEIGDEYYLAHCISADFALGKGIAVEFNRRFDMRNKLRKMYPDYLKKWKADCILIDRTLNLITKERYFHKPTNQTMQEALICMREICRANGIEKVAMPLLGCGLDRLEWDEVSRMIKEIFSDMDIEIVVCRVPFSGRRFQKIGFPT